MKAHRVCSVSLCLVAVAILIPTFSLAQPYSADKAAADKTVKLVRADNRDVKCYIGNELFTVYRVQPDQPKPYFYPVVGPSGKRMTYMFPPVRPKRGEYHPHHRSVWIAVDEVNGVDFWGEKGKIVNRQIRFLAPSGRAARFLAVNDWMAQDGTPVVRERTEFRIYPDRTIGVLLTFEAAYGAVVFEDTKEGLFGVRVHPQLRERGGNGTIVNSRGERTERQCWGKTADWVDYFGKIDGVPVGIAMFDHPDNFRPSRWHVRAYGLFSVNPFGEHAYTRGRNPAKPVHLPKGRSLTLRYGVYFHSGDTAAGRVAERYRRFVEDMRKK